MIILNALYKKPVNIEAFHTHYDTVHMPLVRKVPGLLKAEVEMVTTTYAGEKDDFYMLARMYYENDESFKTAMKSPGNAATGKDLCNFAQAGVSLFVTKT